MIGAKVACYAHDNSRKKLVLEEIKWQEEAAGCARAASQAKKDLWMNWESVEKRKS